MPRVNLRPTSPGAGQLPLFVHVVPGATDPGPLVTGGPVLLDWFLENASPFPTEREFESHVYVDGIFVARWGSSQSPPFQTFGVRNWADLNDRIRLDRGGHTFRLVVDALNQIAETDESDNVFEQTFTWGGDPLPGPDSSAHAVNLVPARPAGSNQPLFAAASAGAVASGPLTVDAPTYISWAVDNGGLASTAATVAVHLYYDGILVQARSAAGIAGSGGISLTDWDKLGDSIRVTPGEHELRLVADPGNFVVESDETDNEVSVVLNWDTGPPVKQPPLPTATPIPAPAPAFQELLRPNLRPYLPNDWDASLVIRAAIADGVPAGRDGPVSAFTAATVNYGIANDSPVATGATHTARLLIDGTLIDERGFTSGPGGSAWTSDVAVAAGTVSPGTHTLTLVIDSGNEVSEADETDNTLERVIEWSASPVPAAAAPTTYSFAELRVLLDSLPDLLLETEDAAGTAGATRDWIPDIMKIADAAYFLATGTALADERIDFSFLPRDQYEIRNVEICLEDRAQFTTAVYQSELAGCRSTAETSAGVTWAGSGRIRVVVDTTATPASVLSTVLHELGHARQGLVAPSDGTVSNSALSALREAQAQVFEAVGVRHIEEFLGISMTSYPDIAVLRDVAQGLLDRSIAGANIEAEHDLGYVLMWLTALQDPAGLGLANELRTEGKLSAASALALYDYLLTITPDGAQSWVAARLANSGSLPAEYQSIALGRLVDGLAPDLEGHPDLRDVAFLAP